MRTAYSGLGLQTYFTSGPTETKAWTIRKGMTAPQVGTSTSCRCHYTSFCAVTCSTHVVVIACRVVFLQAAGVIHTDFERGFIRAEVVNYKDLLESGSLSAAREKGIVRLEGKDYVVQDGDVILFRFNV